MPSSPIRKLVPYADAAKKRGTKVYHLNIGQPDIETPRVFWEKLKNMGMDVLSYAPSNGYESYRQKFTKYYGTFGVDISPDNFIITTGASEALYFTMFSCLNEGDEIIIPEPLYANYIGFATAGNIKIKPITTDISNNFALPSISEFENSITPATKAILVCNPNNPTGYVYSRKELETLREIALKHDLFLFVDEVYREFIYEGGEHISILTLPGLEDHAVVFDSISKRYSACGARVGAVVTRNQEVLNTVMKFAHARLSPPTVGQVAGEAMFDVDASYFESVISEYDARRLALIAVSYTHLTLPTMRTG